MNAFVALSDVSLAHGPTELQPGSHKPSDFGFVELPEWFRLDCPPVAPLLARGEALLFDYRLRHRGLANTSGEPRPLAYMVFACDGRTDDYNFPTDAPLLTPSAIPVCDESP